VSIATVWVMVATLGKLTFIYTRGDGIVLNAAAEHGSLIITLKFTVKDYAFTVAVTICVYVLWSAMLAPFNLKIPAVYVMPCKLKNV
jgi:hypothetical protein